MLTFKQFVIESATKPIKHKIGTRVSYDSAGGKSKYTGTVVGHGSMGYAKVKRDTKTNEPSGRGTAIDQMPHHLATPISEGVINKVKGMIRRVKDRGINAGSSAYAAAEKGHTEYDKNGPSRKYQKYRNFAKKAVKTQYPHNASKI